MKLIKIYKDRVQIKSDTMEFEDIHINDFVAIGDSCNTLATTVTGIADNDHEAVYGDEDYILEETGSMKLIECAIIGSIVNGKFKKSIKEYPTTNITARVIRGKEFGDLLELPSESSFPLGHYVEGGATAYIDGNKFFQRHSCIVGNTGSGKSETVAKILESLETLPGSNIIIYDIHGEYGNISFIDHLKLGENFKFPLWAFGLNSILGNVLNVKEESATVVSSLIRQIYKGLTAGLGDPNKPVRFDITDILLKMEILNKEEVPTGEVYKTGDKKGLEKTVKGEYNGKLGGIVAQLKNLRGAKENQFLFDNANHIELADIAGRLMDSEKHIRCIDFSEVPHNLLIPLIGAMTNLIYGIQKSYKDADKRPITIVCDEAHVYIPNNSVLSSSERRTVEVFEKIAKEGRKFGCTLLVASQRPSELNKTIMAQCADFIVMKLNNEADKSMIKGILPEGSEEIVDSTTTFAPGDAIVIGDASQMPIKISVNLAKERPQSRTIDFWNAWQQSHEFDLDSCLAEYMK